MTRAVFALSLFTLLAGCSGYDVELPFGPSSDPDAVKRSPCACKELPQDWEDDPVDQVRRALG